MLPKKEIEDFVKEELKNAVSAIHNFDHIKRTTTGAIWFVKILGGSKREQDLAYISGLLHDIVRPSTEKICHAKASAYKAEKILEKFNLDKKDIKKIVQAVRDHREPTRWKTSLHQSVYLADKIFEQMGAYVVFRRCMYIGECEDYENTPFERAMISHFEYRLDKFNPSAFPKRFKKLVEYQYSWPINFAKSFSNKEKWAIRLGKIFYKNGKTHKFRLDELIRNFKPISNEDAEIKKETLDYINGNKFKEFEGMIK